METIQKVKCLKCGYEWLPREGRKPIKCPDCQCRKWEDYVNRMDKNTQKAD